MKYFLGLFILPMALFWSWFTLSYYDINFGTVALSRELHEMVFGIYANILGVSYDTIVTGFIKACIIDTALVSSIFAYRRRNQIKAWWEARKNSDVAEQNVQTDIVPAE
ncbi:MAG: DUF6105 family protein [Ahrensia sp.]|nr:DUF6105 family protein [Ahrensia sp.]